MTINRYDSSPVVSLAVEHNGMIFLSGMTADDRSVGPQEQTEEILRKIDRQLAKVSSNKARVLNCTIYLARMEDKEAMNAAWKDWIDPGAIPARVVVEAGLRWSDALVEIAAVAARGES